MKFIAAALLLLSTVTAGAEWNVSDINNRINQTNFIVNAGCSGTLIDAKKRLILTANHCIDSQYETVEREKVADDGTIKKEKYRRLKVGSVTQLTFKDAAQVVSTEYRTRVVEFDRSKDLAVVQIVNEGVLDDRTAAPIACTDARRGERVYTVGNPLGLYSSITSGLVSSDLREYRSLGIDGDLQGDQSLMQISGGTVGGNSGGSVYNLAGKLVGVPVLGHRVNEVLGFAVPVSSILSFLKERRIEVGCE